MDANTVANVEISGNVNDVLEDEFHQFFSNLLNSKYIMKDGTTANFLNGRFITNNKLHIDELTDEVNKGHPNIYIDKVNHIVKGSSVDPLEEIKRKAVEEYKASLAAANNLPDSESKSTGKLTGIGNSVNTASTASSSNSGASIMPSKGTASLAPGLTK